MNRRSNLDLSSTGIALAFRTLAVWAAVNSLVIVYSLIEQREKLAGVDAIPLALTVAVAIISALAAWHLWLFKLSGIAFGFGALVLLGVQWLGWARPTISDLIFAFPMACGLLGCFIYAKRSMSE